MKHQYVNGNYNVEIDDEDGTKIRDSGDAPVFMADFPESIDLNITDRCSVGCPFCYRDCTPAGSEASFEDVSKIIETMMPYTEVALGGGSPIEYSRIGDLLDLCSDCDILANITVHHTHFVSKYNDIVKWADTQKLFGIGCSIDHFDENVSKLATRNTVMHLIAGIISPDDLIKYAKNGNKVLLLGYKNLGRAKTDEIPDMTGLKKAVSEILSGARASSVMSFDNLALKQLDVQSMLPKEVWESIYMGDDGVDGKLTSASMYVDAVAHTYARNSLTDRLHSYDPERPDVKLMFKDLLDE